MAISNSIGCSEGEAVCEALGCVLRLPCAYVFAALSRGAEKSNLAMLRTAWSGISPSGEFCRRERRIVPKVRFDRAGVRN